MNPVASPRAVTAARSETAISPARTGAATGAATEADQGENGQADRDEHGGEVGAASSGYRVRTDVFEGPFDLLLHLILREEVDLWEVQLSVIIDEYLAEMEEMERLDLEIATEFLLIAATLVDLKARRLLPGRARSDFDPELDRYEERDLLLARLLDCKTFQDAAAMLAAGFEAGRGRWPRLAGPEEPFASMAPDPLAAVSPEDLRAAAVRALTPRPSPELSTDHLSPVQVTVREAIELVVAALPDEGPISFVEIARGSEHRLEVVVRFLAVLELCKQGVVDIDQVGTLSDLSVSRVAAAQVDMDLAAMEWDEGPSGDSDGDESDRGDRYGDASANDGETSRYRQAFDVDLVDVEREERVAPGVPASGAPVPGDGTADPVSGPDGGAGGGREQHEGVWR